MTTKLPLLDTQWFNFSNKLTKKRFGVNLNINVCTYRVIPSVSQRLRARSRVWVSCCSLVWVLRWLSRERLNYKPAAMCFGRGVTCLSHGSKEPARGLSKGYVMLPVAISVQKINNDVVR